MRLNICMHLHLVDIRNWWFSILLKCVILLICEYVFMPLLALGSVSVSITLRKYGGLLFVLSMSGVLSTARGMSTLRSFNYYFQWVYFFMKLIILMFGCKFHNFVPFRFRKFGCLSNNNMLVFRWLLWKYNLNLEIWVFGFVLKHKICVTFTFAALSYDDDDMGLYL